MSHGVTRAHAFTRLPRVVFTRRHRFFMRLHRCHELWELQACMSNADGPAVPCCLVGRFHSFCFFLKGMFLNVRRPCPTVFAYRYACC